ncbi:MAG: hypothetical protein J0I48_05325 [Devosia sp.]|uniref:hypothetical protein n=1 Tax=Devosia sp. 66-22 TaxID=1895753 RepID=UPI00092CBD6E|nr:hypothetical protein [Devosia sp. 66-22]MBN9345614.1 hypothetical protein [Devosia sp.]OJX50687.1 MAG: hypothetical protein BGO81_20785 [Devosia sp. 66-22]
MRRKRANGKFAGWKVGNGYAEYRYGKPSSAKSRPIYNPAQRDHYVGKVADILGTWQSSKWEREGDTRAGIRSSLCLEGYAWQRSDDEAAFLVAAGLVLLGASQRPSFTEGQPGYTEPAENCYHCHRPIPDADMTRGQRFCSVECARAALNRRDFSQRAAHDAVAHAAYNLIARSKRPHQKCPQCGEPFRPSREGQRYCSPRCTGIATSGLAPRTCAHCREPFQPSRGAQEFCSKACSGAHSAAQRRAVLPVVLCHCCGEPFQQSVAKQRFCSDTCRKRIENLQSRIRTGNALMTATNFDYLVTVPTNARPRWLTPERFDEMLAA